MIVLGLYAVLWGKKREMITTANINSDEEAPNKAKPTPLVFDLEYQSDSANR